MLLYLGILKWSEMFNIWSKAKFPLAVEKTALLSDFTSQ